MTEFNRRSILTLFSDPKDHYSHRVRIVLAEKGVSADLVDVDDVKASPELQKINPYQTLPTLLDRELMLYESRAMMEYIDERFPHPPLLPVYPVARAEMRQLMYRIEKDWCPCLDKIVVGKGKDVVMQSKKELLTSLLSIAPIFDESRFFMSDEFSLVDCCIAPILWRLPFYGVDLDSRPAEPLARYMQRVVERESFKKSLSPWEHSLQSV